MAVVISVSPNRPAHSLRLRLASMAEKMIEGCKKRFLANARGLPGGMIVYPVDVQGRDGAPLLRLSAGSAWPLLPHAYSDCDYAGDKLNGVLAGC